MPDAARPGFPDPLHDHAPCLADMLGRAESTFKTKGLRLTPLRRLVLQEVAGSHTAVGAYDVLDRLARKGERRLAPISVYRALDSLVEAGIVHRLESRNAFFACHVSHSGDRRQIVLACDTCAAVAEVPGEQVFVDINTAAAATGFHLSRAMVEVIGTCGRCRAEAPRFGVTD